MRYLKIFALAVGAALLFCVWAATGASAAKPKLRIETQSHTPATSNTPGWLQLNLHGSIGTYAEPECHIEAPGKFLNNESTKVVFEGTEEFIDTECVGGSIVGSPGKIRMAFSSGLLTVEHMKIVLDAEGCVYALTTKLKLERAFAETEAPQGTEIKMKLNKKLSHPTEERECPIPSPHAGEEGPVVQLDEVGVSSEQEPFPSNAFVITPVAAT